MQFSVSIDAVYSGRDFVKSMQEIKRAGFNAFEFWSWWDKNLQAIQAAKEALQLTVAGIVTKYISLTDPSKRQEYIEGVKQTIAVAQMLGCNHIISQVGQEIPGVPREEQHRSIVEGLKACVPFLKQAGIMLVIEPLNTLVDHPGYYLYNSKEAFQIVDEVGSPYVKVLYDIYHMQIMEGNIISTITQNIDKIGHFHVAGVPGRHEPYTGELYYLNILKAIEATGFRGYVGLEYFPVEDAALGLMKFVNWVKSGGIRLD
ncbi:TIM barrel protein [Paenibacillus alkaliterrae]|uniref:hydroxypyruvate isomerase family protein n=1 Tax=Paenibacillus alkaliterrae TaxID=320909 RepID=UPI001F2E5671|nr:TIM barrel protein [Paenibacillus alkaliterrae]MCF2938872.1 TIM barrel protein [Paenibacillus alkaliterrae]